MAISFNYSGTNAGMNFFSTYSADSLHRVDIRPREWYTDAVPFLLRNARTNPSGLCGNFSRVGDCYFNPTSGIFSARTVGMLITSNCKTFTTFQGSSGHGNATTTCAKDVPQIAAWIVKRMPIHEPFCPCSSDKPMSGVYCIPTN